MRVPSLHVSPVRLGLKSYRKYGYVPGDHEGESVSKMLEYAYDDWCISRFAGAVGDASADAKFDERSQYYKNLFDPTTGFMRPWINGGWAEPFDPRAVTYHHTGANSWQYTLELSVHGEQIRAPYLLTDAFLFYGSHLLTGKVDPVAIHPEWTVNRREANMVKILKRAIESDDIGGTPLGSCRDSDPVGHLH